MQFPGEAAAKLKAVLSAEEIKELDDSGITYIAFTATRKAKMLENFGRLADSTKPKSKDNLPQPFHVYSMQQAIEEEFILDVLLNYTSYKLAFKLANEGKEWDEKQVEHEIKVPSTEWLCRAFWGFRGILGRCRRIIHNRRGLILLNQRPEFSTCHAGG